MPRAIDNCLAGFEIFPWFCPCEERSRRQHQAAQLTSFVGVHSNGFTLVNTLVSWYPTCSSPEPAKNNWRLRVRQSAERSLLWCWPWGTPRRHEARFFRDPGRIPVEGDEKILAPADGTVLPFGKFTDLNGDEYRMISIFLSLFNVHVNRSSVSGIVESVEYFPGRCNM